MTCAEAEAIAGAVGGTTWDSGSGVHLVRIERSDGHLVVISDEVVCEYDNEEAFDESQPRSSILLR